MILIIFALASFNSHSKAKKEKPSVIDTTSSTQTSIATYTTSTTNAISTKETTITTTIPADTIITKTETIPTYEISETVTLSAQEENLNEWIEFNCSAYCTCTICTNGGGITASGTIPKANWTIAASKNYPFGTLIYIEGYGTFCVEDRGGAINDNKIDIYFSTHQEACNFGRQYLKGYVVRWGYEDGN